MSNYDEVLLENTETFTEDDESEIESMLSEEDESAEFLPFLPFPFLGNKRSQPSKVGVNQNYYRQRPMGYYVTQPQLQSALSRVREDMRKHATTINSVNTRVSTLQSAVAKNSREIARHSKVIAGQAKQIAATNNELKKEREKSLLLYLLSRPKTTPPTTTTASVGNASVPIGSRLHIDSGEDNSLLLLFLMGGFGGGDNLLPLLLLFGNKL